jgi:uncharacterized protein
MTRDRAIEVLRSLRRHLEARGIAHAGIFGSLGRGDTGPVSDIDVVVTPSEDRRLDLIDLGGVQTLLDEGFGGVSVDIVVEPVRRPELRDAIERDRVDAF